jgi:hypothetical protein
MNRVGFGIATLGIVALASSMMAAQAPAEGQAAGAGQRAAGPPPAPPKNLQVLPKDMPAAQVVAIMRNITTALGVQCGVTPRLRGCITRPTIWPPTPRRQNWSRVMMQMTTEINQKLAANIKKPADQLTAWDA